MTRAQKKEVESKGQERSTSPFNVKKKCVDESTTVKFIDPQRGDPSLAELHRSAGASQLAKEDDILPVQSAIMKAESDEEGHIMPELHIFRQKLGKIDILLSLCQ